MSKDHLQKPGQPKVNCITEKHTQKLHSWDSLHDPQVTGPVGVSTSQIVVTAYGTLGTGLVNLLSFRNLLSLASFIYLLSLKEDTCTTVGWSRRSLDTGGIDKSLEGQTIKGWRE